MAGMEDTGMSFAERMMKNMGWSQGKGLGKEEEGMKDFIKPKMKFNTKGIGFMGVDNKWIAHQEHFDDLLTSLNKGEKPAEKKDIACLTAASKLRGRTKFYGKMMRGKDLSNRSSQDLSAIILPLSKKEEIEKTETNSLPSELDGTMKSSQVSMDDYFAKMMAQRKSKLNGETPWGANGEKGKRGNSEDRDEASSRDAKTEKKRKKEKRNNIPDESSLPCDQEVVIDESNVIKKRKRKSENVNPTDASESTEQTGIVDEDAEINEGTENADPPKRRSKKSKNLSNAEVQACVEDKVVKKAKKSKKGRSLEPQLEELSQETHNDDLGIKKKNKKKSKSADDHQVSVDADEHKVLVDSLESKKSKSKKSKHKRGDDEFDISEDGTRLNIDVNLLREIRGSKLGKSKAAPMRDLTDVQIQEIYQLWTSGEYAEFMRRVHSGELPRWVAVEKPLVERMIMGKTKLIDLTDVRELVQKKWESANVEEIWGYTNVAYLVV